MLKIFSFFLVHYVIRAFVGAIYELIPKKQKLNKTCQNALRNICEIHQ